jgi:hypothetical protein
MPRFLPFGAYIFECAPIVGNGLQSAVLFLWREVGRGVTKEIVDSRGEDSGLVSDVPTGLGTLLRPFPGFSSAGRTSPWANFRAPSGSGVGAGS